MKKPTNKATAIYLLWCLIHLFLFLSSPPNDCDKTAFFYPFTNGYLDFYGGFVSFDLQFYDITEFMFYAIAPILIYYAVSFWNKAPKD
jgi:hypothetical protein